VGKPLPSREIRIVDPDTLSPQPPGTPGELLVTSEYLSDGYWKKPEETAKAYVNLEGRTWYRMNDFVKADRDGQLYYVDRGADIIKYKGYRVSCSEIEAVLQDHPAVIGACVVGVPDSRVGERIKGIVVKVPQYIEFRDMLPKSKVGKLLRREIRDEERRKIGKKKKLKV